MKVNLLGLLFICVFIALLLYMSKEVRDLWRYNPRNSKTGARLLWCVLAAFLYLLPFILALLAPYGYGFYAFILGAIIAVLPVYFVMRPLWAIRPPENMLRKRYGIKSSRGKKPGAARAADAEKTGPDAPGLERTGTPERNADQVADVPLPGSGAGSANPEEGTKPEAAEPPAPGKDA